MANQGIHGNLLEVTVAGCNKLKDTEWISRQDPYVCIEYASNRNRTRVCTDGGKNPTFQERFVYSLIEGLRELNVIVWNSNTLSHDDFIGSGKVQLAKVLSQGFDDSYWPLQTKTGRHAGEVRLIMHYSNANANDHVNNYEALSYGTSSAPQVSMYSAPPPPPLSSMYYPPAATGAHPTPFPYSYAYSYPPTTNPGVYPPSPYPPNSEVYPQPPYPPNSEVYPQPPYPYPPQAAPYTPQSYPFNSDYPLQPYGSHYPHGSQYLGVYPPPY